MRLLQSVVAAVLVAAASAAHAAPPSFDLDAVPSDVFVSRDDTVAAHGAGGRDVDGILLSGVFSTIGLQSAGRDPLDVDLYLSRDGRHFEFKQTVRVSRDGGAVAGAGIVVPVDSDVTAFAIGAVRPSSR